jgi:FAD/FMN-containing dehydrogenase
MTPDSGIAGFAGTVIGPGHPDYDRTRRVWNAMHDLRPSIVAQCRDTADVIAALAHARALNLLVAVRGGGHSLPGFGTCEGGIVIDLSPMNRIEVDPTARRATVGGGALLGDVDRATQPHGLAVPAGVISHTGVGGLTLGGGVGRLMRRYGLTVDSLLAVELVTAAGEVLRASGDEHADLFWALRGGGGNFGVVTRFEFRLHEISVLPILATVHELTSARTLLRYARELMPDASDCLLWTSFVRKAAPLPWMPADLVGQPVVTSLIEWSGDVDEGMARLAALREEIAPAAGDLSAVPFLEIQRAGDETFGPGLLSYIKATFADDLADGLIDVLVDRARSLRSDLSQVEILSMGGAIRRVPVEATAFPHRDASWLLNVPASWRLPGDTAYEVAWVRDTYAAIEPHAAGGGYVNFLDDGDVDLAYGKTLRRLAEVKARYDPENLFRRNQNIRPATAGSATVPG